jgi:hypothetical protein
MKTIAKIIFPSILVLFFTLQANAQFYNGLQMVFGKNRVQYSTEKIWSHYRFENFDTYFYQNGKELAINTAKYAESIIPELQTRIDYYLTTKLQFVIFNSMSDMKESNIGMADEDSYNVGGVTQVIGTTVIIYFNGSYQDFERQIRKGIASVLVNQMVFGQEIGANIKNSALLFLPKWYTEGLVSYITDEWSTTLDNKAKNGFLSGKFQKFNNLTGNDAIIAGHSLWKFISDKYGDQAVSNIVYLTRITRSIESGFLYYTGVSFKNLTREWYIFNVERYNNDIEKRTLPEIQRKIPVKLKKDAVLQQLVLHPDGKMYAYSVDKLNKKTIYIADKETKKRRKIYQTGYTIDDNQDFSYPLMAWHPRGDLLAFIIEKKGITHLYYYITETKKLERQSVFGVDKIHDMSYSPNGLALLVSATINGQSDIFLFQLASRTFERITKDVYDDLNPRFVQNGKYIAFASNRVTDTIVFDKDTYIRDYAYTPPKSNNYNIFLYNYSTKSPVLWRVTNQTQGDAMHPMPLGPDKIQYLSDQNGIVNRYIARIDSAISYVDTVIHYRYFAKTDPVTNYSMGIISHDLHFMSDLVTEVVFDQNTWNVYFVPRNELLQSSGEEIENTVFMKELLNERAAAQKAKEADTATVKKQSYPISEKDTSQVNINNYIFRGYRKTEKPDSLKQDSVKTDTLPKQPLFVLPNQRNYDVEYSINELVSRLDYSFLNTSYQPFTGAGPVFTGPGLNAFFKIGINDLLENYRIIGGFRMSFNFRNSEYFLGFENYKARLDKKWIFHRQSYERFTEVNYIQHRQNNIHYILQYPFNNVFALRTSFMGRQDNAHYLSIDYQNLLKPSEDAYWGGTKAELVFDNTRNPQLNIYYGTRWKFWAEYLQAVKREHVNLVVYGFDYRHYTKIHRNFIFANRIAGSGSAGNSKLIYYMGGVDNWLIPQFNYDINVNYNNNYAFQALATNMRGFQQNIRNGNNFVVANSELRLPVFSYFMKRPLKSEILNNFQIVAFGDIGTAWEGLNPFSEDNSLFTHIVQTNSMTIVVRRQKNPIVGGFGTGLRTKLLGYFVKTDLAWGVEDGRIGKPIFYLSFSLDF